MHSPVYLDQPSRYQILNNSSSSNSNKKTTTTTITKTTTITTTTTRTQQHRQVTSFAGMIRVRAWNLEVGADSKQS